MSARAISRRTALSAFAGCAFSQAAPALSDWPQFRGPARNGVSAETGLLKEWPGSGPKLLWSVDGLGAGYGSLAISGDRIFVQGGKDRRSSVHCLNRADGKLLWSVPLGAQGDNDRGSGPRSTPTVEGSSLWVLTESGDLACLKTPDGAAMWRKNILNDFKGRNPHWLLSESPLVDGARLIFTPGARGAGIVAVDKTSGKWIWSSQDLDDSPGYSSCIAFDVGGVRCIANFTSRAGVGVRASDGKLLWHYSKPANDVANCASPVFSNNKVFYTSDYGTGCGLLALSASGQEVKESEVYFNKDLKNHHGGVVLIDGYLYGFSSSILTCMEFETGKVMWRDRSVGKGCITSANGQLYLLGENQTMGLADATPSGYKEKGRFTIPDHGLPSWAYPVVCGGRLYIRNQAELRCYDIQG